jgi:hypothetical protein
MIMLQIAFVLQNKNKKAVPRGTAFKNDSLTISQKQSYRLLLPP